jgi:hypothetical protein
MARRRSAHERHNSRRNHHRHHRLRQHLGIIMAHGQQSRLAPFAPESLAPIIAPGESDRRPAQVARQTYFGRDKMPPDTHRRRTTARDLPKALRFLVLQDLI